jgi:hypothetical protein
MKHLVMARALILLLALGAGPDANAQEVFVNMTPEAIAEAIRLGSDPKAAGKFLQSYVVQTRTGLGTGPLIGYWSTPFARVVLAASAAQKERKAFAVTDVAQDLLIPELQVLIVPPQAAYDSGPARMRSVVIVRRGANAATAIEPTNTAAASEQQCALYGLTVQSGAIVASFPLSAIVSGNSVRVSFSQVVRGSSALTNCMDCLVPFPATGTR